MDDEHLHILRHSLGLNDGRKMYRNHFVTGEGSVDHPQCCALVASGHMTRREGSALTAEMDLFIVTDAGKAAAMESLPKLTSSQARYRHWLNISDATNQSFGEYLKAGA